MEWLDLVEFLLEVFFEVLMPVLAELSTDCWGGNSPKATNSVPMILSAGVFVGALSCWIWPHRLIHGKPLVPGFSLAFAPLIAGRVMRWVGERLQERELASSRLATFSGGALFAFSMALVRFIWIVLI